MNNGLYYQSHHLDIKGVVGRAKSFKKMGMILFHINSTNELAKNGHKVFLKEKAKTFITKSDHKRFSPNPQNPNDEDYKNIHLCEQRQRANHVIMTHIYIYIYFLSK